MAMAMAMALAVVEASKKISDFCIYIVRCGEVLFVRFDPFSMSSLDGWMSVCVCAHLGAFYCSTLHIQSTNTYVCGLLYFHENKIVY